MASNHQIVDRDLIPGPVTFYQWATHNAHILDDEPPAIEQELLQDIVEYTTYLEEGPFHYQHQVNFNQQTLRLGVFDIENFDYQPQAQLPAFRAWVTDVWNSHRYVFDNDEYYPILNTRLERFNRTLALYAHYLEEPQGHADLTGLLVARNLLAENDRRELNDEDRLDHLYGLNGEWIPIDADMLDIEYGSYENIPEDIGPNLSFATWVALHANRDRFHSIAAKLRNDTDSYLMYLIGRPEFTEFEYLTQCVGREREDYDHCNNDFEEARLQSFQGYFWYASNYDDDFVDIDTEHALTSFTVYLGQNGAKQSLLNGLQQQRDCWAREERRIFSNLPRYCPEIERVMEMDAELDTIFDMIGRFGPERQQRIAGMLDYAHDILYMVRITWYPELDHPVFQDGMIEDLNEIRTHAYRLLASYQIESQQLAEEDEEFRIDFIENQVHPDRVFLMDQPDAWHLDPEDPSESALPDLSNRLEVHESRFFHISEVRQVCQDIVAREEEEERHLMDSSDYDSDDSERQGRRHMGRQHYMQAPRRRRGPFRD